MARRVKDRQNDEPEFETVDHDLLEPVNGGNVRRIVFEGREATEPQYVEQGERVYRPRHVAPIDEIEFEIDHLGKRRTTKRTRTFESNRTLYETDRGSAVREDVAPSRRGGRRVLYTTVDKGTHQEERRFSDAAVDRIIAGVELEPEVEVIKTKKTKIVKRKRKVVEKVPVKAEPEPEESFEVVDGYQPQCEAVTKGGKQCRNSSRKSSKYCGAHKGYKPRSLDSVMADKDTAPANENAEDTLPGEAASKKSDYQAQCAAYTKDGMQCKNSSRKKSKYCGAHKKYRAPSKDQLLKQMDTPPRWAGAKDTVPNVK